MNQTDHVRHFRALHAVGNILVLPNAWDAGSARLIESCGAEAIATTSSGLAWACGYPDGDAIPPRELTAAVARIARVLSVPLTVDAEGGYANDPACVGETIAALIDVGVVGVNLEDGSGSPDLLCAKISAARKAAAKAGIELFINARTDVFLRGLVAAELRVRETLARTRRYRDAGCDGIFVPGASQPPIIRELVAGTDLPVNIMALPMLPPVAELKALGVRRFSAGSGIAQATHGLTRKAATQMMQDGIHAAMFEAPVPYAELNALFSE